MKNKKFVLVPLLLASAGLTACGSSSSNEITLTVWEDESNITMVEELANQFVREYKVKYPLAPKLTINFVDQSEKSAIEKLITVGPTGNGPDVLAITHDTISNGVRGGVIAEASFDDDVLDRMSDGAINAVTYDGKIYGYPITSESMTLMYVKKDLSSDDVASFENLAKTGKKIAMDFQIDGGYYCFGLNNDSILFGEDGKDEKSVKIGTTQAVANWVSLVNNYKTSIASMTPETSLALLTSGQISGVVTSPFMYSSIVKAIGVDKLGVTSLPTINGEEQRPFSGYKAYAVNAYSKNPSIAQELASYLVSDDAQEWRLATNSYLPTVATYTENMNEIINDSDNKEHLQGFMKSLDNSMTMPNVDKMANFWKPMNNAVNTLWTSTSVTSSDVQDLFDQVTKTVLA